MKQKLSAVLSSDILSSLETLGRQIRVARTRRRQTARDLADRIGISLPTLRRLEQGDPAVSLGAFAAALWAMGLLQRLEQSLSPESDDLGTAIELARMPKRVRKSGDSDLDDR